LLAACGDGDGPRTSAVRVVGDSLGDSGTFGFKFTIQESQTWIWSDHVAAVVGVSEPCARYIASSADSVALNPAAAVCSSYAVADSRINVPDSMAGGDSSPFSIVQQLRDSARAGDYRPDELLLLDGGGNDAADLAGAYIDFAIASSTNQAAAFTALNAVLSQMGLSTNGTDTAAQGQRYMVALANTFTSQIITNTLNKGAAHVAVLDIPDITLTPRFSMVIGNIAASDSVAAAQIKQLIQSWISAYNSQLAQNFSNEKRVAIVPFYADFTDEITHPQAYSLSNVSDTACPATGTDSNGLPTYDFPTCTPTALDAMTGKTAGWWKNYAFSDGFHPTPYGHQLLAASVSRALARAGWL